MTAPMRYSDYLCLDQLLDAQKPLSAESERPVHEELLFIVTHQAAELWFKQVLADLDSILGLLGCTHVDDRVLGTVIMRMRRMCEIWQLLGEQLRILETMGPIEFLEFRGHLGTSSGFQSYQFRLIENKLGLSTEARVQQGGCPYDHHFQATEKIDLQEAQGCVTLFDAIQKWLERTPFLERDSFRFLDIYEESLNRWIERERALVANNPRLTEADRAICERGIQSMQDNYQRLLRTRDHCPESPGERRFSRRALIAAVFIRLYSEEPALTLPDLLLDRLIDLDSAVTEFRQRHRSMVLKMIGQKSGTGGSSGHDYLRQTADQHRIFTELHRVVTLLLPKSVLPDLPEDLRQELDFSFVSGTA